MFLKNVTKGIHKKPLNCIIYGVAGVGKTTVASKSEKPIFLGGEDGSFNLNVSRFPRIKAWDEVDQAMRELLNEKHDYKTLVVDTIDSLEPLLWQKICKDSNVNSIELACGGFGKGYMRAMELFILFRNLCDDLRFKKDMNIIILAHSQSVKFFDPLFQIEYDRYELKLHKKSVFPFVEWTDNLLFANFQTFKSATSDGKEHAIVTGQRKLYSVETPSYKAKNRFSLPPEMNLEFSELKKHIDDFYNKGNSDVEALKAEITALAATLQDNLKEIIRPAFLEAGEDFIKLSELKTRIVHLKGAN